MKVAKPVKVRSNVYRSHMRLGGKSVYVYGQTEAECRRKAALVKAEHQTGVTIQSVQTMTVAEAIDKYIDKHTKLSPSTVRGYLSIRNNTLASVKDSVLADVDWQRFVDKSNLSPKSVQNAIGLVKSVMRFHNLPIPQITMPQNRKTEHSFLDASQLPIFLSAIRGSKYEIPILLGLHSLRRSEMLDITFGDVDLKNNIVHVRGAAVLDKDGKLTHKEENKNASSRRDVPIMIPRLAELIRDMHGKPTDYLVTCYPNAIYKEVNRICQRNGLPLVGCHGLRHSFVSLAYHIGWSELATMRVAGYSNYNTMRKIYTHLAEIDQVKNISAMTDYFTQTCG